MYYHLTKKYSFFSSWYTTHFCDPSRKYAMLFRISRHVRNLIHAIKKVHDQNKWFGKLFIVRAFFSFFFSPLIIFILFLSSLIALSQIQTVGSLVCQRGADCVSGYEYMEIIWWSLYYDGTEVFWKKKRYSRMKEEKKIHSIDHLCSIRVSHREILLLFDIFS